MGVIAGPNVIAPQTVLEVQEELEASLLRSEWITVRASLDDMGKSIFIKIVMRAGSDENAIENALVSIESAVLKRIPEKIPIFDDRDSWSGVVSMEGAGPGMITDGTGGGWNTPGPTVPRPRHGSPEDVEARSMVWWLNPEKQKD